MGRRDRRFGGVWGRGSIVVALVVLGLLAMASAASAATFTVNDANDAALATPGGTTCVSTDSGGCTLRAAVQAANDAGGSNTIVLPGGDFKLTIPATSGTSDNAAEGDLDVLTGSLTIAGVSASSTIIDANHIDRAFAVHSGASLSITNLTIENGESTYSDASDYSIEPGYGGAIYNDGTLTVTNSALDHNEAYDDGGGIYTADTATSTTVTGSDV